MAHKKRQADFRMVVKTELLERDMTVTELAASIGHARSTVSQAINCNRFPRVRAKILGRLRLKGGLHVA